VELQGLEKKQGSTLRKVRSALLGDQACPNGKFLTYVKRDFYGVKGHP